MKQCEYCAKTISYHEQYCGDSCQTNANQFYINREKYAKFFMVTNVICVFGIPVGLFLLAIVKTVGAVIAGGSCALLGFLLMVLPFPTEGMMKKYGIKKARNITRMIGLACFALGLLIAGLLTFVF